MSFGVNCRTFHAASCGIFCLFSESISGDEKMK